MLQDAGATVTSDIKYPYAENRCTTAIWSQQGLFFFFGPDSQTLVISQTRSSGQTRMRHISHLKANLQLKRRYFIYVTSRRIGNKAAADLEFYEHEKSDNSVSGFQMFCCRFHSRNEAKKFKGLIVPHACERPHTRGTSCTHQAV